MLCTYQSQRIACNPLWTIVRHYETTCFVWYYFRAELDHGNATNLENNIQGEEWKCQYLFYFYFLIFHRAFAESDTESDCQSACKFVDRAKESQDSGEVQRSKDSWLWSHVWMKLVLAIWSMVRSWIYICRVIQKNTNFKSPGLSAGMLPFLNLNTWLMPFWQKPNYVFFGQKK